MSTRCEMSISLGETSKLVACIDPELKHVIAVLDVNTNVNDSKFLEEIRDFLKNLCGEEFNIVNLNSRNVLVHVVSVSEEDIDKSIINTAIKLIEEKLKNCNIDGKIRELLMKYKPKSDKYGRSRRKGS